MGFRGINVVSPWRGGGEEYWEVEVRDLIDVTWSFPSRGFRATPQQAFTGNQFQAISKKRTNSFLNVQILFWGIERHCLENTHVLSNWSCSMHALQLVSIKLPAKVASSYKAISIRFHLA